jgi:DNA topoisomerase-1
MEYKHLITTYWLLRQFGGGSKRKWTTFQHNGVLFPPEYIPHNIPILYNGEKVQLSPLAEESATLYSKYIDTEYVKNSKFNKNFWNDWKRLLDKDTPIKDLEGCNFHLISKYLLDNKLLVSESSKEDKLKNKEDKELAEKKYKIAIVDGKEQPVGNFRMEPPGIFIGRGCHPKLGKIKKRIYPEDITLNLSTDAPIPDPPTGHKWHKIVHDRTVEWIASWKDTISDKTKYVWLSAHSDLKAQNDIEKYDLARKLKRKIKIIREENDKNLVHIDIKIRQIATALYFIDNLALRVGNEKSTDEADTVGVSSLRCEHIQLLDGNRVKLDFLGKDSVRYVNTIKVTDLVYKNIQNLTENKEKHDNLFDKIVPNDVNKYLQSFMKGLSAKVFRTFNASYLFQKELKKITNRYETYNETDKINILLDEFNKANAKVATLCNHQKAVSKSFGDQLDKISERIKDIKAQIKKTTNKERIEKLRHKIKLLKIKKELKVDMKNISLGTSKINYIDPRITIAFLKKHNLPVDKIFSKTLQEKFNWAFNVTTDFVF